MAKFILTGIHEEDIETIKSMGNGTYIDSEGIEWTREELLDCYRAAESETFVGEYVEK